MTFANSESGAVTVDWVVLTAALVGLGLATMSVVSGGVQDASDDVDSQLSGQRIFTSFVAMNHTRFYDATVAKHAAAPEGYFDNFIYETADEEAANLIETYTSWDDARMVQKAAQQASKVGPLQAEVAGYAALGESGSLAEYAAVEGYTTSDFQAIADADFGGDLAATAAWRAANSDRALAKAELIMELADERGLTY